jgi:SOS-response transcriptional repressor LexA
MASRQGSMEALMFIRNEVSAGRRFPTAGQIKRHMGWKTVSSAKDCLARLTVNGHIRIAGREPWGSRWRYKYELND